MTEQLTLVEGYSEILQLKPNARIIDVACGNRQMYPNESKFSNKIIFCDKEPRLKYPPDVVCDWRKLPFPDNYFHCAIWDPPHIYSETSQFNKTPWFTSNGSKHQPGWYGAFKSEGDAHRQIFWGQREISRVALRLCFKWCEAEETIDEILTLFDCWNIQFQQLFVSPFRKYRRKHGAETWWVKMVRKPQSQFTRKGETT